MTDRKITRVLSLGAGIQSSCLLLMSCRGILPKLDYAVFADTGWEPKAVYDQLEFLKGEAAKVGIEVVILGGRNLRNDAMIAQKAGKKTDGHRFASMPIFTKAPDGSSGRMKRQCTSEYKLGPITKWKRRAVLGLRAQQHAPKEQCIETWIGFSVDEVGRAKPAREPWDKNVFPLLNWPEMGLGRPWSRHDCIEWLNVNFGGRTWTRSACIGCPNRRDPSWAEIKNDPEAWADAVDFDQNIRDCEGLESEAFLHEKRVPLEQVDLRVDDPNQIDWVEECEGLCGL